MNVNTVTLCGGLAVRVVGLISEFDNTIAQLARMFKISEPDALTLFIRSANYIIDEKQAEIDELKHRLNVIAARA